MAYITNEDIERRVGSAAYVQLADDDGDGTADAGVVDEVREGAEGEVNSHLAVRYLTPIDLAAHGELAGLLASITLDLAEFRLRARRPPMSDEARQRAELAVQWLGGVAAGAVVLPALTPPAASTISGVRAAAVGEARVFTLEEMAGH